MKPGQTVRFRRPAHGDETTQKARGVVLSVSGPVARVDFRGAWFAHEDGGTVRTVPVANLTPADKPEAPTQ